MDNSLIKRQAAIDAITTEGTRLERNGTVAMAEIKQWCIDLLEALPSAYRPTGEWEIEYNGNGWNDYWDYTCPNCGKKYERADAVLYKANFCPNCGSRLKGADDEA